MTTQNEKTKPKQSYCLNCKAYTSTILYRIRGPFTFMPKFMSSISRVCEKCGKPKARTELETEEEEIERRFPHGGKRGF
jgi:hypothetical protein